MHHLSRVSGSAKTPFMQSLNTEVLQFCILNSSQVSRFFLRYGSLIPGATNQKNDSDLTNLSLASPVSPTKEQFQHGKTVKGQSQQGGPLQRACGRNGLYPIHSLSTSKLTDNSKLKGHLWPTCSVLICGTMIG
ncbi:unnamed protein product [Prunus armeniaca]|uniref:Uncharacterized protein n=1 Tax=Prunus armeniaca TaxID=36596 RepID=A0A6J5UFL4_PRUAR|nr:unnamed protein product [Prunus armeniaca]